jgi:hypothetical protein
LWTETPPRTEMRLVTNQAEQSVVAT